MLLGIDHITFNSSKKKKNLRNWNKIFDIKKAKNHPYKKIFLRKYKKNHEIAFYNTTNNEADIELTKYHNSKCDFKKSDILISKKKQIIIFSNLPNKDKTLLKKNFDINSQVYSIFNKKKINISFKKKFFEHTYLDDEGFVALALVVNDIEKYFKNIKKLNIEYTKLFRYRIFNKKVKIFFFRLYGGLIIEIIEYL